MKPDTPDGTYSSRIENLRIKYQRFWLLHMSLFIHLSLVERSLAFHIFDSITAFSRTLSDFFQEKTLFFEDTVTRGTHGDLVHFKWMSHRKLEYVGT